MRKVLLILILFVLSLSSVYASSNPIGLWHFDEGTGNIAYDSSGNGNDGTISGAEWTTGISNSSLNFDGVDDYISPPPAVLLHPTEVTFEAWVKPSSFPSTSPDDPISQIICHGYGGHFELGYLNTGNFTFGAWHPDVTWTWSYSKIKQPDKWYHVVGVLKDFSYISIYVNGILESNLTLTKPLGDPGQGYPFQIGAYCQPYKLFFNGKIDEIAIYDRVLTSEEIWSDYVKYSAPSIIVPDDYSTIQEAINNANDGDTIFVRNGTYYENVLVNKTITLIGEDESTTIIDGNGVGAVVNIIASNVTFSGFTVRRGWSGIQLTGDSKFNTVSNNTITSCDKGISLTGASGFNTVSNNTITSCGVFPYHYALEFGSDRLSYDRLYSNKFVNNYLNIGIFWGNLSIFLITMDTTNTINGKPVYYLVNQSDLIIDSSNYPAIGYLAVINSRNVTIKDIRTTENNRQGILFAYTNYSLIQNFTTNTQNYCGIQLMYSQNNVIRQSTFANNYHGIRIDTSNYNMIEGNSITNNYRTGIAIGGDGNNIYDNILNNYDQNLGLFGYGNFIYHNNFFSGLIGIFEPYNSSWDNGYPSGGNYWSNYDTPEEGCYDSDYNGICDSPYVMDANNKDNYPFTNQNGWIDTTSPIISILSPINNNSYYKNSVLLNFTINEPTDWVGYILNNTANVTITEAVNLTISDGWNNIIIFANDTSGNMGASDNVEFFYCKGDINSDKNLDIFDLVVVALAFGSDPNSPNWNSLADLNNDNIIDIFDLVVIALEYGKTC